MSFIDPIAGLFRQLIPVVAALTVTAGIAYGQSYYHAPNDTLTAVTTVNNSVTMNITQVHPGSDTLRFKWAKLSVTMPVAWTATICDNNTCYPSLIDSAETLPVLPGDDGLMLIHCSPFTTPGTGVIRYTIYELHTPQQVDTLTWIIEADATTGLPESAEGEPVFSIKGNRLIVKDDPRLNKLRLIDTGGKVCFTSLLHSTAEIELPVLPAAVYVVELSGSDSVIQQRIWYSCEK
jgi:hypothetical protein